MVGHRAGSRHGLPGVGAGRRDRGQRTLRTGYWPHLSPGEVKHLSLEWMVKIDNPGMAEWELEGRDVYGAHVAQ